ncbi:probable E3 ubiquitin-protein ligase RNF144A-B isoform X1 [Anguilla anguilla]|uniref:probable E3 ubiquitin-protein ligase RNF144A-B isoform X1 n=1 Tax=Anguilla anguilla TaxID=7936 RepID=UPI0015AD4F8E|nr:probable E3 ubiquitin-protein ligase RNF144A-B isoform X1 [Anguilla anguilla]XP_035278970.1 probable E3 ubiquitin-protein ligase RNF144A-B isoform X1 [Anguilla anguilla]
MSQELMSWSTRELTKRVGCRVFGSVLRSSVAWPRRPTAVLPARGSTPFRILGLGGPRRLSLPPQEGRGVSWIAANRGRHGSTIWTTPPDHMTTARYRPTWDLALDPLLSCKLCLGEFPLEQMTTITQCQCVFCTLCLKQYVELLIKEGLETAITCPDSACPKQGHLQENEIELMVAAEIMQRYRKLQFEKEVLLDPCRTWCPSSSCQAVCQLQEAEPAGAQLVQCSVCSLEFCSACRAGWHPGQGCQETPPTSSFLSAESSLFYKGDEDDAPIKRCPKCKVYIERDEGCAQMMCKNCKHAFCWYCLESLDDDFLLIHYDKGPCRNKLGHSRASVIWHRTQVVGIFAGFGLLLLVASPFLLLATPFVLCCKCKCSKGDDDPLPT